MKTIKSIPIVIGILILIHATIRAEYCNKTIPPNKPGNSGNGRLKMVVMFVDWPDKPATEPIDLDAAQKTADNVDDWFQEQSMCRMGIDFTIIPKYIRMPKETSEYKGLHMKVQTNDAMGVLQEMYDTSYNFSNYNVFIMDYPVHMSSAGLGGPGRVWAHFRDDRVLRHEISHAVGLEHEDQPEVDIGTFITPYGRYRANWISYSDTTGFTYKGILSEDNAGTYRVYDFRSSLEVPNGLRMVRISNPRKTIYYKLYAFYDELHSSVTVYITDLSRNPPVTRLDFTPNSNSNKLKNYEDGGLKKGASYYLDTSDIRIKVINTTSGTAIEPGYADIQLGFGKDSPIQSANIRRIAATPHIVYRAGIPQVQFQTPTTGTLFIRDLVGRTVQSTVYQNKSKTWIPKPLIPGTYILDIRINGKTSWFVPTIVHTDNSF